MGTFTSCRTYPSGTVRCENDDRSTRMRFIPDRSDPELHLFKLDFWRRDIVPPQVASLQVLVESPGLEAAAAKNEPCRSLQAKLVCQGESVEVLTPFALAALEEINAVRFGVNPPCDPNGVDSPCGPQNDNLLPPVEWNDALVAQAAALVDTCPIFVPAGVPVLLLVYWSPEPLSEVEVLEIAIQTWASKRAQYNPVTGNCLRQGDTSCLSYKTLVAVEDVAVVATVGGAPRPLLDGVYFSLLVCSQEHRSDGR